MEPRISLVTLGVEDLDRARRFYGDRLGWPESSAGNAEVAFFRTGGVVVALYPGGDTSWGGRTGYFADPDGHPWEIAWNPHFPLGPDGAIRLPD